MTAATLSPLETVKEYYRLIDSGDLDRAFMVFAPDATVRFGDLPDLVGRDAISAHIRSMIVPIARAVSHEVVRGYAVAGPGDRTTVICEAVVTYRMLRSGNVIPHNAVTISEVAPDGQIAAQRNVGNLGPVIEDHRLHAES